MPFLSKSANASLYSVPPSVSSREGERAAVVVAYLRYRSDMSRSTWDCLVCNRAALTMMFVDEGVGDREEVESGSERLLNRDRTHISGGV